MVSDNLNSSVPSPFIERYISFASKSSGVIIKPFINSLTLPDNLESNSLFNSVPYVDK